MGLLDSIKNGITGLRKTAPSEQTFLNQAGYVVANEIADSVQKGKTTSDILSDIEYLLEKKDTPLEYTINLDFSNAKEGIDNRFVQEKLIEDRNGMLSLVSSEAIDDTLRIVVDKNEQGENTYRYFNRKEEELFFNDRDSLVRYIDDFGGISKEMISLEEKENIITGILQETETFADKVNAIKLVAPYFEEGKIYLPLRPANITNDRLSYVRKEDFIKNPRIGVPNEQMFMQVAFNKDGSQDLAVGFLSNDAIGFEKALSMGTIHSSIDEQTIDGFKKTVAANQKGEMNKKYLPQSLMELEAAKAGFLPDRTLKGNPNSFVQTNDSYNEFDIAYSMFGEFELTGLSLNCTTLTENHISSMLQRAAAELLNNEDPYEKTMPVNDMRVYEKNGKTPDVYIKLGTVLAYDLSTLDETGNCNTTSISNNVYANNRNRFKKITDYYTVEFNGKTYDKVILDKVANNVTNEYRGRQGQMQSELFTYNGNESFKSFAKDFIKEMSGDIVIKNEPGLKRVEAKPLNLDEILEENVSKNGNVNVIAVKPNRASKVNEAVIVERSTSALNRGSGYELYAVETINGNKEVNFDKKITADMNYVAQQLKKEAIRTETYTITDEQGNALAGDFRSKLAKIGRDISKGITSSIKGAFNYVTGKQSTIYKVQNEMAFQAENLAKSYILDKKTCPESELREKYASRNLMDMKSIAIKTKANAVISIEQGDYKANLVFRPNGEMIVKENDLPERVVTDIEEQFDFSMMNLVKKADFIESRVNAELNKNQSLKENIQVTFSKANDTRMINGISAGQLRSEIREELKSFNPKVEEKSLDDILKGFSSSHSEKSTSGRDESCR